MASEAIWIVFYSPFGQKVPKLSAQILLENQAVNSPSYNGNWQLQRFGHAQKAKFQDSFWVEKFPCPLNFYFLLILLAASFVFLTPFFLDFAGYLVSFGSVGNNTIPFILRGKCS